MQQHWIQRWQLFAGWITLFIIGTDLFVVSPLLPSIAEQFHIEPSKAGWMVTAFSIMYALGAPWFGALSDKWGRRKMIVYGLIGFAAANMITGFAAAFPLLVGSRVLAGLSASMITSSIFAITGDVAPEGKGGRWLSIVTSGFLTALWSGTPLGTIADQVFGWRVIFFALALATILLAVFNAQIWPKKSGQAQPAKSAAPGEGKLGKILVNVAVTMFWAGAVYGLYTYLGTGLKSARDFSSEMVAAALVVYGIGAIIGSLSGGRLADFWNARVVSIGSLLIMSISLALIGFLFNTGWWLWPLLGIWSFAGYVSFSSFQASLTVRFPYELGSAMAWNQTAMYIGITLGSILGNWVLGKWVFLTLPVICSLVALLGVVWFTFLTAKKV
ncbi:MFS transporter [Virgibacillus siamensis]|uniref:MFS transporter n=2 Tax=Virgibacillus siamensis TaxID=480071 RepID=A0ABN1GMV2_9BACI